jgi:hypothetical protein
MFDIPDKRPVPWDQFRDTIRDTGEYAFVALEQKRYGECSVAPGPGNDAIVGAVLVVWSDSLISVRKNVCCNNWPQSHVGWQVDRLFKMIREGSVVTVITESSDVAAGFKHCSEQHAKGLQPAEYTAMPQLLEVMKTMSQNGI